MTTARRQALKAFDTTATITDPRWFEWVYEQGFRLYVMHSTVWGTGLPWPRTQPQLRMAIDAGLKVAVYTRDPRHWRAGIQAVGRFRDHVQFFPLDVETDPGCRVTRDMVDGITAMGIRPVIYSGAGMWHEVMGGNVTEFADVPLWETHVTGAVTLENYAATLESPAPVPFGGWNTRRTPRIMVQQAFDVALGGVGVDLNSVDGAFLR
ncbi:hypothetical protein ACFQE5_11525 [Pseudonocardia hispaniensis]|uniref:Uncharacterized protein n=1 Tax=Pseudonocardia hispaniensis TaxID=904933 RepID=A0ABW1J207_9PSEU